MKKALFPIALGAILCASTAGAREPTLIKACQTINQPGSYELANNLTATGDCLVITAAFVTIDLAGFAIVGTGGPGFTAISGGNVAGITVRNGSISGFSTGVDIGGDIVEGLRVSLLQSIAHSMGISANGIVKGNIVGGAVDGVNIGATGIITGNFVGGGGPREVGISAGPGSTLIGNISNDNQPIGISVQCPSNVIDNTAINNLRANFQFVGDGCNNSNTVGAP